MATTRIVANRICRMEGGYARPDAAIRPEGHSAACVASGDGVLPASEDSSTVRLVSGLGQHQAVLLGYSR
jgi:hypothetical protein